MDRVRDRYTENHVSILAKSVLFDDTGLRPILCMVPCMTWQFNFRTCHSSFKGSKIIDTQIVTGSSQVIDSESVRRDLALKISLFENVFPKFT